ncbi:MAG TPA: hypothetical protein VJT71_06255 [Pyrinomonadaceae bacterium]|nr:hypothetical protein [Pyrinomonadaceae bacterium]
MKTILTITAGLVWTAAFFTQIAPPARTEATAPPRTHIVTVNSDGTFEPVDLNITEGDTVRWVGLGRTDSIVQITYPGRNGSETDVCGVSDSNHRRPFTNGPNEFDGPKRFGVSGIFSLGPDGPGIRKVGATIPCRCTMPRQGPCKTSAVSAGGERLCPEEGNPYETLEETWSNPDVTGVTIRLRWNDIQPTPDAFVWKHLDREMNQAVKYGKLFTLDVKAGAYGTPAWIFVAGQRPVKNLIFKDTAEEGGCGREIELGSPADLEYRKLYIAMIRALARHVTSDARWFQALAHVKMSGANLFSSEARLPKRCEDSDGDGRLDRGCKCNTQIWAESGYTPEKLYEYYRHVGNAIYEAFYQRKSIGYQLIPAGFPRVTNRKNFMGDTLSDRKGPLAPGSPTIDDDLDAHVQTKTILEQMRKGRFVDPDGTRIDQNTGQLFVVQQSGLGQLRQDEVPPLSACIRGRGVTVAAPPLLPRAILLPHGTQGGTEDGCPSNWATDQGTVYNQFTGFQTNNDKKTADDQSDEGHTKGINDEKDVESALWNMTVYSNGVFIEIYEQRLWEILKLKGSGPSGNKLDPSRSRKTGNPAPFSKSLHEWMLELHDRRHELGRRLNNPYAVDPFPNQYEFTFAKSITARESYYYINPGKCSTAPRETRLEGTTGRLGKITVAPR